MEYKKHLMRDLCDTIVLNHVPDARVMTIKDKWKKFRDEILSKLRKRFSSLLDRISADDCRYAYAALRECK